MVILASSMLHVVVALEADFVFVVVHVVDTVITMLDSRLVLQRRMVGDAF